MGKPFLKTEFSEIREFALPLLVEQASIQLMPFVSSFISRGMGTVAVSGVNLIENLNNFTANIFVSIAIGATVVVSQYRGMRNPAAAGKSGMEAMKISAYLAILTALVLFIFEKPAMDFFLGSSADQNLYYYASVYFIASLISYPFYSLYSTAAAVLRGSGQSRASLVGTVVMNLSYIVSGLILVNVFDMGIVGTGMALVISRIAGMTVMLIMLPRCPHSTLLFPKFRFLPDLRALRPLIQIGLPICIEQVLFSGGRLITQRFAVDMGNVQMSINSIGNVLSSILMIPGITLSNVIIALVGKRVGAKDYAGAKDLIDDLMKLGTLIIAGYVLLWVPFTPAFLRLYTDDPVILTSTRNIILVCSALSPVFWLRSFTLCNAIKGAGDTRFTTVMSMFSMFAFRVVLAYIFGFNMGMGALGIWLGMFSDWIFRTIVYTLRYKSGKWLGKGLT